jgi:hypothetical protein
MCQPRPACVSGRMWMCVCVCVGVCACVCVSPHGCMCARVYNRVHVSMSVHRFIFMRPTPIRETPLLVVQHAFVTPGDTSSTWTLAQALPRSLVAGTTANMKAVNNHVVVAVVAYLSFIAVMASDEMYSCCPALFRVVSQQDIRACVIAHLNKLS